MTIHLRRFETTDTEAVKALFLRSWRDLCERLKLDASKLPADSWAIPATWVAIRDNEIVGFTYLRDRLVDKLYVDPKAQRTGVGTALLAKAREEGANQLWVDKENTWGRAFYEKNGWTGTGVDAPGTKFPIAPMLEYEFSVKHD